MFRLARLSASLALCLPLFASSALYASSGVAYTCEQQKAWGKCNQEWMSPACDYICKPGSAQAAGKAIEICLLRHGQSIHNVTQQSGAKGSASDNLTSLGVEQARDAGRELASHYAGQHVTIWNSPFRRARQTLSEVQRVWASPEWKDKITVESLAEEDSLSECNEKSCDADAFVQKAKLLSTPTLLVAHYHIANAIFKAYGLEQPQLGNADWACFTRP